ncbi:ArsR family transcriptional regulator [Croceibacterium mercuriale]|uniref:ArsR family transcriptional regulator n=1 Tax=Croceibacterium mercuriale TaxID=1572751 RepID=A0A0B2BYP0_9SPHN|nr:metalloregulator ArsR/SmtB family transcription factor [Croceibacterium mercuriale]KHL24781.1 ArsR family transcriptional regulator [Croceibacterium mercuriale]
MKVVPPEDMFRVLGDGMRLRTLVLLRSLELTVGELAQVLGQSQPRMSQHIKALQESGLVRRRKEGTAVFLRLGPSARVQPLFALLDDWAITGGEMPWFAADRARLKAIRADRAAEAQRFFERNAWRWDELRALHVPDTEVDRVIDLGLGDRPLGRLLDIGTGTGRMLEQLAGRAHFALGVDRSPEMLRFARARLAERGTAAALGQADMYALPMEDGTFDTVILHQVLHYAHHPEAAIAEAARVLAPGGTMVIADMASHEREDLRRRFAHARLGFTDRAVLDWLGEHGLEARVVAHLAGELTISVWAATRPAAAQQQQPSLRSVG